MKKLFIIALVSLFAVNCFALETISVSEKSLTVHEMLKSGVEKDGGTRPTTGGSNGGGPVLRPHSGQACREVGQMSYNCICVQALGAGGVWDCRTSEDPF